LEDKLSFVVSPFLLLLDKMVEEIKLLTLIIWLQDKLELLSSTLYINHKQSFVKVWIDDSKIYSE